MVHIQLEKIQLKNVRCYGDDGMEMDFPTNNLTVFTGHVGAGKSTIVKSVSMALYGDDGGVKGEKLTIDDMVNEKTGKNLEIHLYFTSRDDLKNNETHKYEIHLYHKHTSYGSKLVFMRDGVDISANGKLDTYRLIEKTLIPKQVYHNIYYFTQQAKNFFTALPNSEQKEIFNSILDLSEYDNYYNNAKEKGDSLKMDLKDLISKKVILENEIGYISSYIENTQNKIDEEKNKDEKELCDLEKKKYSNMMNISIIKNELSTLKSLSDLNTEKDNLINNFYKTIQELKSKISNNMTAKQELADKYKKSFEIQKTKLNNDYLTEISEINKSISNLSQQISSIKQEILQDKMNLENEKLQEERQARKSFEDECSEQNKTLNDLNDKYNDIMRNKNKKLEELSSEFQTKQSENNEKYMSCKLVLDSVTKEIENLNNDLTSTINEIESYESDLKAEIAVCRMCGQPLKNKDHIKKHIDELTTNKNNIIKMIDSKKLELDTIKQKYDSILKDAKECKDNYAAAVKLIESEHLNQLTNIEDIRNTIKLKLHNIKDNFENNVLALIRNQYVEKIKIVENSRNDELLKINKEIDTKKNDIEIKKEKITETLLSFKNDIQNKYQNDCINLDRDIAKYEEQLKMVEDSKSTKISEIDNQIKQIESKNSEIESIENSNNIINYTIDKLKNKTYDSSEIDSYIEKKQMKTNELISINTNITTCEDDIGICDFWKSAFSDSGIKSMLIDSAIPHMNECVREELDRVAPGMFTVSFDTLSQTKGGNIRDKFSINIINNMKGSTGHKKLSGGEKRIVDLCCMTALRSLAEKLYNKRFCHIFYDEILDSLDSECKEQFCRNAKYQSQNGLNITLITHDLPEDVDPDRVFPF